MSNEANELSSDNYDAQKGVIFEVLRKADVTEVRVDFDGSGDEGQFGEFSALRGGSFVDLPELKVTLTDGAEVHSKTLQEAIEDMCCDFLENTHEGWEIDDGSYGEFTFDVGSSTVTLDFNSRYIEVYTETHTF
jgi:hypothetical protein